MKCLKKSEVGNVIRTFCQKTTHSLTTIKKHIIYYMAVVKETTNTILFVYNIKIKDIT